jgi:membrane associated rhomboid family serine protease
MIGLFANLSESAAVWQMELRICWVGLTIIGAIVVAAFAFRSWKVAAVALVLVLLYSMLLKPWRFIAPIEAEAGADPWAVSLRRLGVGWAVAVIGTLVSLALGLMYRPRKHETGNAASDT